MVRKIKPTEVLLHIINGPDPGDPRLKDYAITKLVELKFAEFTGFTATTPPSLPTRKAKRIVLLPRMPGASALGIQRQCWPTVQPVRPGRWSIQCKQSLMPRRGLRGDKS